jgi:protein-S-isoprenylcysteine O-methyltransferase Ste14
VSYSLTAKRLRLPLGFIFAALYLVFATPTRVSLAVGAAVAAVGVAVRAWASGHISKNQRLATGGPYAYTRNPLYFGSFLIAAGFAVAAHWLLLLVVAGFFVAVYAPTMERERANIAHRFPEDYALYAANVPAFFPRLAPWPGGRQNDESFSVALYMKHGEWKAALGFALAMAWLVIRVTVGF